MVLTIAPLISITSCYCSAIVLMHMHQPINIFGN